MTSTQEGRPRLLVPPGAPQLDPPLLVEIRALFDRVDQLHGLTKEVLHLVDQNTQAIAALQDGVGTVSADVVSELAHMLEAEADYLGDAR